MNTFQQVFTCTIIQFLYRITLCFLGQKRNHTIKITPIRGLNQEKPNRTFLRLLSKRCWQNSALQSTNLGRRVCLVRSMSPGHSEHWAYQVLEQNVSSQLQWWRMGNPRIKWTIGIPQMAVGWQCQGKNQWEATTTDQGWPQWQSPTQQPWPLAFIASEQRTTEEAEADRERMLTKELSDQ